MKADSRTEFGLAKIAAFGAGFGSITIACAYLVAIFFETNDFGKASAATFDSQLVPATSSLSSLDIGSSSTKWKSIYLSQNMNIDGKIIWMSASTTATGGAATNNSISMLKQGLIGVQYSNVPPGGFQTITISTSTNPLNVELSGIRAGDRIFMTPPSIMNDDIVYMGARTLTDSIEVKVKNTNAATSSTKSNNWSYLIIR